MILCFYSNNPEWVSGLDGEIVGHIKDTLNDIITSDPEMFTTFAVEAMKKSMFSLAPEEYVVDYFDDTDKLFYLSHGVDTSYYIPNFGYSNHKLLMCANNGVAGDYGADRKGFRYGIESMFAVAGTDIIESLGGKILTAV